MLNNYKNNIAVIGSGFSGLAAAAILASKGNSVSIFEKNKDVGGRARTFTEKDFLFDMGPSWYWMPDVFEHYYNIFNYTTSDFYELKKLDPGFTVIFGNDDVLNIPENFDELCGLFESIEKGSAKQLQQFLNEAEYKYNVGMNNLVYQPGLSIREFITPEVIKGIFKIQLFSSFSKHVKKYFKDPRLISLMEFPVLFLGAMPKKTPALYSLMNYSGLKQGTFYPMGGFGKVVDAFKTIAEKQGVIFHTANEIKNLEIKDHVVHEIVSKAGKMKVDAVIGAADYHHIESALMSQENRSYTENYWEKKTFAPSCLIFYLGINKKIDGLNHHNLFFDENFENHANEIYTDKKWPEKPLFYVCCPSKTDPWVAPEGYENLFLLMPVAAGLKDNLETREHYFRLLINRIEKYTGVEIEKHIIFKKSYSVNDFKNDYHAYKGNAYGLANTLFQTAIFKPKIKSKKVNNLFFAGQLTIPGPGVPPSIISGQVSANEVLKYLNQ